MTGATARCLGYAAAIAGAIAVTLALAASPALAGEWMQVSCVNPNGSPSTSDGWSSFTTGSPGYGSNNDAACGPNAPMSAILSDQASAPVGTAEVLEYRPPSGSTLVGGSVDVNLYADGYGLDASGTAVLYEPAYQYDGSDVFFQCAAGVDPCSGSKTDYSGTLSLPANRGGNFYLAAGCGGVAGQSCDTGATQGGWSVVRLAWAYFLLSNAAAPQATAFSGSALQAPIHGTAHLVFTASDPGGPGVYTVTAAIDGRVVSATVPNTNNGKCSPVGTDKATGALIFDWQQPCPETEVVDVPVPTAGLPDGEHELSVTVTDAAGNSSTVLDQSITTSNPVVTPRPRSGRSVQTRFRISWHWHGTHTTLRRITAQQLPRRGRVLATCSGSRCPKLQVHSVPMAAVARLLRELDGKRFTAGDDLRITVTSPGLRAEHVSVAILDGKLPSARLLAR